MRLLVRSLLIGMAVLLCSAVHANPEQVDSRHWTDKYDRYFQKYTKRYFGPNYDWKWFKAQAIAESGLKPGAVSSTGARGLMQILPSTYAEIREKNPWFSGITQPRWNIAAGIYYDRFLFGYWPQISEGERLLYAFGSYNAGLGGMLRAYRRTGTQAHTWAQVEPHAPPETRNYVERIQRLRNREQVLQAAPRRLRLEMLSQDGAGGTVE